MKTALLLRCFQRASERIHRAKCRRFALATSRRYGSDHGVHSECTSLRQPSARLRYRPDVTGQTDFTERGNVECDRSVAQSRGERECEWQVDGRLDDAHAAGHRDKYVLTRE